MSLYANAVWAERQAKIARDNADHEAGIAALRDENKRLRYHLTELGKVADRAGLVLATIGAENSDEAEQIQQIIDGISTWAAPAILGNVKGPNAKVSGGGTPSAGLPG